MQLTIKQGHINAALAAAKRPDFNICQCCPTALALKEQMQGEWSVGIRQARLLDGHKILWMSNDLRKQVESFGIFPRKFKPGTYKLEVV